MTGWGCTCSLLCRKIQEVIVFLSHLSDWASCFKESVFSYRKKELYHDIHS
ncbi:hypothetical protein SLEP1_g46492 [Rubroshorea leprosula]|uniref:Uncharacterized protein n=1 Tax=Rubroshorea leprosula TaxID=152421 RepID=A0AAV5LME0_9ROSI|nr:hypothetical protein SLEP1_g46492 [Rubroshorea leprosula]